MDIGAATNVSLPVNRTTSAVGDGDVGQKGTYYRRQRRDKNHTPSEASDNKPSPQNDSRHIIDIRV